MRSFCLIFLLVLSLSSPAWARLGETKEQLVARYGRQLMIGSDARNKAAPDFMEFIKGGFRVRVWLLGDVSVEEEITNKDNELGKPTPLTSEDIQTLLQVNSQGHLWNEVDRGSKWTRDDGALAVVSATMLVFDVKSKELIDANEKADKPATTSLKDF